MLLGLQHRRYADLPLRPPQHLYEWLHADRPRPAQNRPQAGGGLCDVLQLYTGTKKQNITCMYFMQISFVFIKNIENIRKIIHHIINKKWWK